MKNIGFLDDIENQTTDLDISWINTFEKMENVNQNFIKEPMENIDIFFIYINTNSFIEKIIRENHPLELNTDKKYNVLKNEYLLHLIQSKKNKTDFSYYKIIDILLFNVDLSPEQIQHYYKNKNTDNISKQFFHQNILSTNDIKILPSLYIFHNINSLFLIFQEKKLDNINIKPKSILKNNNQSSNNKITKKVKIVVNEISNKNNDREREHRKKFTRKNI